GWYSAPNYSDTLDIIWPCLFTNFLCCWSAIHPDIPHQTAPWHQRYLERTVCLLLGAVTPELFIYFAYQERHLARGCCQQNKAALAEGHWSMTHALFAEMGGYAVEVETIEPPDADNPPVLRLYNESSIYQETWCTKEDILDKGKADNLVKSLTIIQLVWLLVQSSARFIQQLPLTTLELRTMTYIPCAMLMYYFWWEKP
ncbi:hypothetical protein EK21DRAFT_12667, partial [Setomelanomma holmii]